ncbi:sensor histidine kinase [Methylocystis heyeri]|uniref:histidine kinase n=1 Tax=Methylocystis heyeri TaxID=391905 RepID=A0A6B8KGP9_9HYPH|nr:HAMP domain-containing sensor histidine kinase [Methylocystis heyeri]QGM46802.1 sensor histidine kinase [Methylocystis heyeri]
MRRHRSLSFRLFVYLFLVQLVLSAMLPIFTIIAATSGLSPSTNQSLNGWGEGQAQEIVVNALRRDVDNRLRFERGVTLRDYLRDSPSFLYAGWDASSGEVAEGSSQILLEAIRSKWDGDVTAIRFHLSGRFDPDLVGILRPVQTRVGKVVMVVYGYTFHLSDLVYLVSMMFSPFALATFSPFVLPAALTAFFLVRQGLAPLRAAAAKAANIDAKSLSSIPDEDVPEEVIPFVTAVNDALARVHHSVAAQRRFLANAAHELRTPITVLCSRIDNPDEATFLQELRRDARRIRTVVEQLLSAAQMSQGKTAAFELADLRELALTTILDYMPLAVANGRNLELDRPDEPVMVKCDRYALERVIVNLVENACRAEPEDGTVQVIVSRDATIEVVDHGVGIAPEDRERIFEPFWRKSNCAPGTGLGLAISKEIVESHGGRISIRETCGSGATFEVSLPRAC